MPAVWKALRGAAVTTCASVAAAASRTSRRVVFDASPCARKSRRSRRGLRVARCAAYHPTASITGLRSCGRPTKSSPAWTAQSSATTGSSTVRQVEALEEIGRCHWQGIP